MTRRTSAAVCSTAGTLAWVVIAAAIASAIPPQVLDQTKQPFISPVAFLALVGAPLGSTSWRMRDVRRLVHTCVASLLAYTGTAFVFGNLSRLAQIGAAAVLVAALIEELVFRVVIPRRLYYVWHSTAAISRATLAVAIGASQLLFAGCHFVTGYRAQSYLVPHEWGFLFVAGLSYAILVALIGVGMTAGIHAGINSELRSSFGGLDPGDAAVLSLLVVACVVVSWLRVPPNCKWNQVDDFLGSLSKDARSHP